MVTRPTSVISPMSQRYMAEAQAQRAQDEREFADLRHRQSCHNPVRLR